MSESIEEKSLEMRPHHLERAIRYVIHAKDENLTPEQEEKAAEDKKMYDYLQNALELNPDVTVTFVADFDLACKECDGIAGCRGMIKELSGLDKEVAERLGLELNTPYKIKDVLEALENEKAEKPRKFFAITYDLEEEELQGWRDNVRQLLLKEIGEPQLDTEKMNKIAQEAVENYKSTDKDAEGTETDNTAVRKKRMILASEVVDEANQLTFVVKKTFSHDKSTKEDYESISFHLEKDGSTISEVEFVDKGDVFKLKDRLTDPGHRGKKYASMLHDSAESFLKELGITKISADVAQVDAIKWTKKLKYKPQTQQDAERREKVLNGDESLVTGEELYVFEDTVPEEERTVRNRKNAYRIKVVKKINL